jgi:HEAT repeat protein
MMDTRTSPADPDAVGLTVTDSLTNLRKGLIDDETVAALSDLSRSDVQVARRQFPSINESLRRELVERAAELGKQQVELDFRRLMLIALHDERAAVRFAAVAGLEDDDSRSTSNELLRLAVEDSSVDVRAAAIELLTETLDRTSDPDDEDPLRDAFGAFVIRMVNQDDCPFGVKIRSVEALGILPQTIETRALINAAWEHGDPAMEVAALLAISRSREVRWLPLLRENLGNEDAETRYAAVRAIGATGGTDDVEALARHLLDEDSDVRLAAISALGEISGPGAVRVLRNFQQQADDEERVAVTNALDAALLGSEQR